MYVLYYLTKNHTYGTIEVETLNEPVYIPEDLIFTDLRKGINFIKEPNECANFTHLERLIFQTEFFQMETIKEGDFRKAYSYLDIACRIDEDFPFIFPINDPSQFNLNPLVWIDEGDYKLRFNGGFNLENIKLKFYSDTLSEQTLTLENYREFTNEDTGNSYLYSYDDGDTWTLSIDKIQNLINEELNLKPFRWLKFVNVNTGLESEPISLSKFLVPCTIRTFDLSTHSVEIDWIPELDANQVPFVLVVKDSFGVEKLRWNHSSGSTYYENPLITEGDQIFIYNEAGDWLNSNYHIFH